MSDAKEESTGLEGGICKHDETSILSAEERVANEPGALKSTEGDTSTGDAVASEGGGENDDAGEKKDVPELVPPDVDEELVNQMLEMGFTRNRAVRALHFSGAQSVDVGITWLADHEDDPDLDDDLLVPSKKMLTKEQMRQQAEDLRKRAKEHREREDKALERNREAERIRIGKEMMAAKRLEEEQARKRLIEEKKREKQEEHQARERIKLKLEEDRKERRRRLGLPEELTEEEKAVLEEKRLKREAEENAKRAQSARFVKPVGTLAELRQRLVEMKQCATNDAAFKTTCSTLLKYMGNVARSPDEEKYRRIRLANAVFQQRVASMSGGVEFLEYCGFKKDEQGEFLTMPREAVNKELLNGVGGLLDSALKNPFFGSL